MAGYIFTLDSEDSLKFSFENGVYSTKLRPCKKGYWGRAQEGTFADYITMRDKLRLELKIPLYSIKR